MQRIQNKMKMRSWTTAKTKRQGHRCQSTVDKAKKRQWREVGDKDGDTTMQNAEYKTKKEN